MPVPSDSARSGGQRQVLADLFGPAVEEHEDCMTECLSLLRLYNLSPQDLFYKFEAFSLSSLAPESRSNPTLQDFRALRQSLQANMDAALAAQTPKRGGLNGSAASAWGSSSGAAASARKKPGVGIGTLFGTPGSASRGSPYASSSSASSAALHTPSRNPAPSALRRGGALGGDNSMDLDDSPSRPRPAAAAGSSTPTWAVSQTLNSHVPACGPEEAQASSSRVRLMHGRPPNAYPTRYMFERGAERGEALDDYLETMSTLLVEAYALSEEDLADPSLVHQESVYVVGRICPNLVSGGGTNSSKQGQAATTTAATGAPRLQPTQTGTLIESSKLQGAGQRVPIWLTDTCTLRRPPGPDDEEGDEEDVSGVDILGMFPGMIVGLKGRNGGGMGFGVEEILLLPPLPLPATPPSQMLETQYSPKLLNGGPMSILVASGPFTSEDDLEFAPWHALMDNVERASRSGASLDVLILLGPFIPVSHPLLPFSDLLPSDLFKRHFTPRLNALSPAGNSRTATLLVPSVHDALCAHAAFPQPGSSYDRADLALSKGVRPLPNPALFSVADVVFGAGTADVLRDLRAEELVRRLPKRAGAGANASQQGNAASQSQDALARSVRHVLSQRSFYPLFPPPQPRLPGGTGGGGVGGGASASSQPQSQSQPTGETQPPADLEVEESEEADREPEPEPEPPLPLSLPSLPLTGFTTVTPDVLILPSGVGAHYTGSGSGPGGAAGGAGAGATTSQQQQPFAKIVDGVVVINPGGLSAGSAARMTVRPLERARLVAASQEQGGEEEAMEHAVWERCRVDLVRF